jgi:hypothetical protein
MLGFKAKQNSLFSGVTSHYVIDQSMISICDMKETFGGVVKHNTLDSI